MGSVTRVTGSENVYNLPLSSTGTLYKILLNPVSIASTSWLTRQASLFNKYKVISARLRFVPFVPTSTQGRVTIGWAGDVEDEDPTSVVQVTQYENSRETPVWMETSCNMGRIIKPEFTVDTLPTNENCPGQWNIWTDFGTSSTAGGCGSLYLDYTIDFWSRAAYAANM